MKGGIEVIAETICEDMRGRLPGQNKKQREGLALLTATMLDVRSANLMDLAASLPRQAERLDMRYQWISRVLGNGLIWGAARLNETPDCGRLNRNRRSICQNKKS